ncbi:MAG: stage III sporulation protein AB [Clostridiales bacterium]|jgi:stage III sporulation protein AB|nr:stage III sporulation protein AB [Clostridiales bacterium]
MLRALVVVAVFLGAVTTGALASNRLRLRQNTLKAMLASVNHISMRMEYTLEPLAALAHACKNDTTAVFFDAFAEKLKTEPNAHAAWADAMCYAKSVDPGFASLHREESKAFEEYALVLGRSGYRQQHKNASLLQEQLALIVSKAQEENLKKGRLYKSLGVLGGIAVAILLI